MTSNIEDAIVELLTIEGSLRTWDIVDRLASEGLRRSDINETLYYSTKVNITADSTCSLKGN